jgi:hypothetical protein
MASGSATYGSFGCWAELVKPATEAAKAGPIGGGHA